MKPKRVDELGPADFSDYPIWEFVAEEVEQDETFMLPVAQRPVDHMNGRLIYTQVVFSCGRAIPALLGNLSVDDPRSTRTFLRSSMTENALI